MCVWTWTGWNMLGLIWKAGCSGENTRRGSEPVKTPCRCLAGVLVGLACGLWRSGSARGENESLARAESRNEGLFLHKWTC